MKDFGAGVIEIITSIVTVAIVAVLVSRNAQTSNVIKSAGEALSSLIGEAVSPVTK